MICHWRANQIFDLRDTDKSRYIFHSEAKRSAFFNARTIASWSLEGEKRGFFYVWADYYLQPNTKPNTVGRHCAWADHYLQAVICRSRCGLLANEKVKKLNRIIKAIGWSKLTHISFCSSYTTLILCILIFRAWTRFEPMTFALALQCSTNWAMKSLHWEQGPVKGICFERASQHLRIRNCPLNFLKSNSR